jgi:hypothetical protein
MIKSSPINDHNAWSRVDFYKDDVKITIVSEYEKYDVWSDEDSDIDFAGYDPEEGAEMGVTVGWVDEEAGVRFHIEVEGDIDEEEKAEIIQAWEENEEQGVKELGWEWSDRELYFKGSIEVLNEETKEVTVYGN